MGARQIVVAAVVLFALPALAADAKLTGRATVVDGDTLRLGGVSVRLKGIAAPELSEPGGQAAKEALMRLVGSGVVTCRLTGERTHGRAVGFCEANGTDLNRAMVEGGFALSCPRYSARYVGLEPDDGEVRRAGYRLPGYCARD